MFVCLVRGSFVLHAFVRDVCISLVRNVGISFFLQLDISFIIDAFD